MKTAKWILASGVMLALYSGLAQPAWSIDVEVAEAPTTDLQLTLAAINSAQTSLTMNIYELSSSEIADALVARIQAGVRVQIIEEGQPVGGLSAESKAIISQLIQTMKTAGSENRLFEMTSAAGGKRRYRWDHAKYAVIDETSVLIGSENYSPTGNPEPGSVGNRGWEVLVHDADLAQEFIQVFQTDSNTSYNDVLDLTAQGVAETVLALPTPARTHKPAPVSTTPAPVAGTLPTQSPSQLPSMSADSVEKVTSPDTSLTSIVALIRSAQTSIDIEQMTFESTWDKDTPTSPIYDEVMSAAKRGVTVRVLLNDETVFPSSKPKNTVTVANMNQAGSAGASIQALVANVHAMGVDYIHNKGMIVDGNKTLISSINWDENSFEKNRETAVVITSSDIASHYETFFQNDWNASAPQASTFHQEAVTQLDHSGGHIPSPALLDQQDFDCPSAVTVQVQIGTIAAMSNVDASFAKLSGTSFDIKMARDPNDSGCIFVMTDKMNKQRVLEIRPETNGETMFRFEGYTTSGKIYSVRAKTDVSFDSTIDLSANVYDASGSNRKLGPAELMIETQ